MEVMQMIDNEVSKNTSEYQRARRNILCPCKILYEKGKHFGDFFLLYLFIVIKELLELLKFLFVKGCVTNTPQSYASYIYKRDDARKREKEGKVRQHEKNIFNT